MKINKIEKTNVYFFRTKSSELWRICSYLTVVQSVNNVILLLFKSLNSFLTQTWNQFHHIFCHWGGNFIFFKILHKKIKLSLPLVDEHDAIKSSPHPIDILEFEIHKWFFLKFSVYKKFLNTSSTHPQKVLHIFKEIYFHYV